LWLICKHHEKTIVTWYQVTSGQLQPAIHNLSRPFIFLKLCRMNSTQFQWKLIYLMGIPEFWYNGSWAMPQYMPSSWPPWALNCTKIGYELNFWAGWALLQWALSWCSFFAEFCQNEHQEDQN
jgi:hypothetical protein